MRKSLKRMLRNSFVCAAAGLGVTIGSSSSYAESVTWNMATYAGGHWLDIGIANFVKRVSELTEGRVTINITQPGTLGSVLKVSETVQSGIAEVGHNWPGYDWGIDSAGVVFGGWSGGLTPEEQIIWLYNEGGAELLQEWRDEVFDVVSLPCSTGETELFLHAHKPIRTIEDFQGLRLRTSGAWADIATELGASTVVMPGGEVFPALERSVVDAIEWAGPGGNLSAGFHTIAKYIIVPGIHAPTNLQECMFNKDAWNSITDHDRAMIRLAAKLNTFETFLFYADIDLEAWKTLHESEENEFVQLDESFIKAADEASHAWAAQQVDNNEWFKRAYDSQRALQKKLNSWSEFRLPIGASNN